MRIALFGLICTAALVSACSKTPQPEAQPAGRPAAAATAATAASPAAALFSRPRPRAGLWKTSMTTDAGPGIKMDGEICLDSHTGDSAFTSGVRGPSKSCTDAKFSPTPGGVKFSVTCRQGARTVISEGTATGDFSKAYAVDVTNKIDPPPPGMSGVMHVRVDATWEGPCRPGQKPGQASMKFGGFGRG